MERMNPIAEKKRQVAEARRRTERLVEKAQDCVYREQPYMALIYLNAAAKAAQAWRERRVELELAAETAANRVPYA